MVGESSSSLPSPGARGRVPRSQLESQVSETLNGWPADGEQALTVEVEALSFVDALVLVEAVLEVVLGVIDVANLVVLVDEVAATVG